MAATVHTALVTITGRGYRTDQPVAGSVPVQSETLTSSASSAAGTKTADIGQVWEITVTGGNVWVAFGAAPVAALGSGFLILDGETRDFSVSVAAEKIAVKDA